MKRLIGFILFWMAVGMIIDYIIKSDFLVLIIIAGCLVLGYNLFCCD